MPRGYPSREAERGRLTRWIPQRACSMYPWAIPAPDFATDVREGANLFTGSVLVLDAKTGAYKNHFKLVPKDGTTGTCPTRPR